MAYQSSSLSGNRRNTQINYNSQRDSGSQYGDKSNSNYYNYNLNYYQRKQYSKSNSRGNHSNTYATRTSYNKDTSSGTQSQLWMGDLDPKWSEKDIRNIWESLGENPTSIKMMKEKVADTRSVKQPYCFINFASQNSAEMALLKNGLQIPGSTKALKLNWAGSSYGGVSNESVSFTATEHQGKTQMKPENSIFVGDLNSDVTEPILLESFSKKYPGQVKQVKIMHDPLTGLSKNFGFVRFFNLLVKLKALQEMSGFIINNRPIRVGAASGVSSGVSNASHTSKESIAVLDTVDYSNINLSQVQPALNQFTDSNNTTLVVRGLSSKFSEDELGNHFIAFGDIVYCKISADLNTGYIKFYLRASAELALMFLHGSIINDCNLKVTWGKSSKVELRYINFEPDNSPDYSKAEPGPDYVGAFLPYYIRFDKIVPQEVKELSLKIKDQGDPLTTTEEDELYIKKSMHRDELLDGAPI
ncbi:uncharacterized protein PRCAT00001639001 [Priceomyces carsonii]|uniref:uncharacterized protein n=1 Tax=Priceomyces carsonii TaxID=28549 RepID=UPI002EDB239D|nr:unnamed protein product [Priceomyces carsonii]